MLAFCLGLLLALQSCRHAERSIGAGDTAVFDLRLEAGQFQAILLDQLDGDLTITLVPPTGEAQKADYFYGTNVEEKLFWRAESAGTYKLMITPLSKKEGFSFRYKLTIEPPRQPTPQDLDRLEAQRLYAEAVRSVETSQSDDQERARQHNLAAQLYEKSAAKWHAAGEPALSVVTLIRLGQMLNHDDEERAKSYFEQALQQALRSINIRGQAEAYCNLGLVYSDLSKTREDRLQARQYWDEALKLSLQAQDRQVEASVLSNLGLHYFTIGEYQPAAEQLLRSLDKMRKLGDQEQEALVLSNLGAVYRFLGLKAEAERAYREALKIAEKLGDSFQQARAYNGLGKIVNMLGDGTLASRLEAKENFKQAVARGGKTRNQQAFEQNLGNVCYELGEMYRRLGEPNQASDNFGQAQSHLREALRLQQEQGGGRVHQTLTSLGLLSYALGDTEGADHSLQEALKLSRTLKDEYQEATVLAALARMARDRNDLKEAKARIEEALKLIELMGLRIQMPEWRASYAASQQHFYDLQVDILVRLYSRGTLKGASGNYHKVAWEQTERARKDTLWEVLDSLGVSFSNGVDPKLIEEQREIRARIMQAKLPPYPADQLSARYQEIQRQIRRQNPRCDRLLYPVISTESLTELQKNVLNGDTILLEYALGQDRSYLWAITPSTFEVFTLPPRVQLENAALEVYQAMTSVAGEEVSGGKQPEVIGEGRSQFQKSERQYQEASARLSHMLLDPVASRLGKKKLLIVGDGILGRIPFGALPVPATPGFRWLLQDHEIAYAPSTMTLLALHRERDAVKRGAGSVVAIADPVFNSKHRQAAACPDRSSVFAASASAPDSTVDSFADNLRPVSFDDDERAKFRQAVFGQSPSAARKELFQFAASRDNVINDRLAQFNDIIFYTHGIFNVGGQGMTGLALSRLNERCELRESLLSLNDIYNLKLSADLVTLVACNTARDRTMRGFGIGSIAHGFMFAGASHVLGALWDVDGPASLELITRFYLNRREGVSASETLRAAQLSFLNDSQSHWRLPYYWAGFVLMGEVD